MSQLAKEIGLFLINAFSSYLATKGGIAGNPPRPRDRGATPPVEGSHLGFSPSIKLATKGERGSDQRARMMLACHPDTPPFSRVIPRSGGPRDLMLDPRAGN